MEPEHPYRGEHPLHQPVPLQRTKTKKDDTGQTAIYSAGEHLELCCGKARLVLTKDGQIFLNGTKIHLQGKEQVNGDSLLINWNCAASKSPPKTPDEKQDTPDMREY